MFFIDGFLRRGVILFAGLCLCLFAPRCIFAMSVTPSATDFVFVPDARGEFLPQDQALSILNDTEDKRSFVIDLYGVEFGLDGSISNFVPVPERVRAWFSLAPETFPLAPGESTVVNVKISPQGSDLREHGAFAVIVREDRAAGAKDALTSGVASLFFVSLGEDLSTAGEVRLISASAFDDNMATLISVAIQNTGDVAFAPDGRIMVMNMWGDVVAQTSFNKVGARVPAGSLRTLSEVWQHGDSTARGFLARAFSQIKTGGLGRYVVTFEALLPNGASSHSVVVWLWPRELLMVLLLLLALCLTGGVVFWRRWRQR